jgi:hypothetical protein
LKDATAGDPITGLKWTRKTCRKLANELNRKGFKVGHSTIPRLAQLLKYTQRVNHKRLSRKKDKRRDRQMLSIESQRKRFTRKKQPEISVDGKKKQTFSPTQSAKRLYMVFTTFSGMRGSWLSGCRTKPRSLPLPQFAAG